jgi:hypothetical protein
MSEARKILADLVAWYDSEDGSPRDVEHIIQDARAYLERTKEEHGVGLFHEGCAECRAVKALLDDDSPTWMSGHKVSPSTEETKR